MAAMIPPPGLLARLRLRLAEACAAAARAAVEYALLPHQPNREQRRHPAG